MNEVIKVENISKKYIISHREQVKDDSLKDLIIRNTKRIGKRFVNLLKTKQVIGSDYEEFWALKDISFKVSQGERIGIIGRNGAGKTTLLKILSRITEPSGGQITIKGRTASLLEVGTGFHPELTGRENIFLNGSILGMGPIEMKNKFDEIVDFSGVEKFIDTPVKRYSSGMYVRLAFAVAAHLDSDILMVDEVLAVGDIRFRKKCLSKMGEVSEKGDRTVLFVSHNMQAVRKLCPRTIVIEKGTIISDAPTEKSLKIYNQRLFEVKIDEKTGIGNEKNRRGGGVIRFTSIELLDIKDYKKYNFKVGENIRFKISYKVFQDMQGLVIYIGLLSGLTRELVTSVRHIISSKKISAGAKGTIIIELPDIYIRPGEYPLYFHLGDADNKPSSIDVLDDITSPLIITNKKSKNNSNFEELGYFSTPSKVIFSKLLKN